MLITQKHLQHPVQLPPTLLMPQPSLAELAGEAVKEPIHLCELAQDDLHNDAGLVVKVKLVGTDGDARDDDAAAAGRGYPGWDRGAGPGMRDIEIIIVAVVEVGTTRLAAERG